MTQCITCLLPKSKETCSEPQNPDKNPEVALCASNPSAEAGGRDKWILLVCFPSA